MDTEVDYVDVPTPDGTADAIFAAPADGASHPGVLVYMDAFGVRPRLEEMARRLAGEGYTVLVPNLFYRDVRAPLDLGDLKDPDNREKIFATLGPLREKLTPDAVRGDATAYVDFLTASDRVADGPIATVGYCMGGGLALRTAALAPDRVDAVATFHAGRVVTDQPDSPHLAFADLDAEVYMAHADNDASMPPEQQQQVGAALAEAGVTHRTELYEGAAHGFTMADTAAYDAAAEQRHWERLLELLGRTVAR